MDLLGEAAWHTYVNQSSQAQSPASIIHTYVLLRSLASGYKASRQPAVGSGSSQASNLVAASPKRTFQSIRLKGGFVGPNFDAQMQASNASSEFYIKVIGDVGQEMIYQHIGQLRPNTGRLPGVAWCK
ncbi:hypothetical protein E4U37_006176 [Claviceps purpurea]|nr:hypothetical protein E4U37_006176 [Claviceps purpurea]